MHFFRRRRRDSEPSLETIEENPELRAAERAVNNLPDGPPSTNPASGYLDATLGPPPRVVRRDPPEGQLEG